MNTNDQIEKTKRGYHFTGSALRNGDQIPAIGEWISVDGPIIPCESGLHMSEHPMDALQYAPGCTLHMVEIRGDLQPHGAPIDKLVGRDRRIIATIDATQLLRDFARWCAMQVVENWDCPKIVMRWLTTGDESIRSAALEKVWSESRAAARSRWRDAWSAAWEAAESAAESAAWSAAPYRPESESAAKSAAKSASFAAVRLMTDARESWSAAKSAALSVSRSAQREKLQQMIDEAFARKEPEK